MITIDFIASIFWIALSNILQKIAAFHKYMRKAPLRRTMRVTTLIHRFRIALSYERDSENPSVVSLRP